MSFDDEWARCAPWLQAALSRGGRYSLAEARAEVESGRALLWPGQRSAAVTEINRDLHIWLAGGDLAELIEMERACSAWAKANGFDQLTIKGRRGWGRALAGYREASWLVKDL